MLSIAAPANHSGKTTLACRIAASAPGAWQALKVSTIYRAGGNCARASECSHCSCLDLGEAPYAVIADPAVLAQPDSDTGDMVAAGAWPVNWGLARPGHHAALWGALAGRLDPRKPVLVEGGQIARVAPIAARIAVCSPFNQARWKADAWDLLTSADLVLVNPWHEGRLEPEHPLLTAVVRRLGGRAIVFDVARSAAEWPAPLARLVDRLLASTAVAASTS